MKASVFFFLLLAIVCEQQAGGYSVSGSTYNTDGSSSDVQAAISAASAGSTVLIPAGTYQWSSPVTVSADVSLQGAGTSSTTVACSGNNGLLVISNPTPFACTIGGITFNGNDASGNDHIGILIKTPALLHDCNFTSNGGLLDMVRFETNGGVIWNWTFYDHDRNEEAICFQNSVEGSATGGISPSWTANDTMGLADTNGTANCYVEDCTFNEMHLQALDFSDNSRVVVRHCTFNNSGFASHGLDSGLLGRANGKFIITRSFSRPLESAWLATRFRCPLSGGSTVGVAPALSSTTLCLISVRSGGETSLLSCSRSLTFAGGVRTCRAKQPGRRSTRLAKATTMAWFWTLFTFGATRVERASTVQA
jgi:hypothetical protein